jgi:hypothetical protein
VVGFGVAIWQWQVAEQRGRDLGLSYAANTRQAGINATQAADAADAATAYDIAATDAADAQASAVAAEQQIAEENLNDAVNAAATAQAAALSALEEQAATAQAAALNDAATPAAATQAALQGDLDAGSTAQAVNATQVSATQMALAARAANTQVALEGRAAATQRAMRDAANDAEATIAAQGTQIAEAAMGFSTAGWVRFEGRGMSIMLPERYVGGSPEDVLAMIDDIDNAPRDLDETLEDLVEDEYIIFVGYDFPDSSRDPYTDLQIGGELFPNPPSMRRLVAQTEELVRNGVDVVDTEVLDINGEEVGLIITEADFNDYETTGALFIVARNDWLYLIAFITETRYFDDLRAEFEASVRTFQVTRGQF